MLNLADESDRTELAGESDRTGPGESGYTELSKWKWSQWTSGWKWHTKLSRNWSSEQQVKISNYRIELADKNYHTALIRWEWSY